MNIQFCTGCGTPATPDHNHCIECGQRLKDDAPPRLSGSTLVTWMDVGGKSFAVGAPLVALFDFLSPRVALLPVAAVVAVIGLVVSVALRRLVAPGLPAASWLRRMLAPEARLHKSPVLVATGVLSALMVAGAAWSSVNAAGGGVIASKFDAAKNAQMQLGVLQGLQKEQRLQTAVLEDIREGRTTNPRRELANQGILWTHSAFTDAIRGNDVTAISLFLAGGMRWTPADAVWTIREGKDEIAKRMLEHPELLSPTSDQCTSLVFDYRSRNPAKADSAGSVGTAFALSTQDKRWLRLFCAKPGDVAKVQSILDDEKKRHQENLALHKQQLAKILPASDCRQQLLSNGGRSLFQAGMQWSYNFTRGMDDWDTLLSVVNDQLTADGPFTSNRKVLQAVDQYCAQQSARKPTADISGRTLRNMQQVVDALT